MNIFGNLADARRIEFHDGGDLERLAAFVRDGILPIKFLRFSKMRNVVSFCVLIKDNTAPRTPRRYQVQINHATNLDLHLADTANTSTRFSVGNIEAVSLNRILIETYDGLTINVSVDRIDGFCEAEFIGGED